MRWVLIMAVAGVSVACSSDRERAASDDVAEPELRREPLAMMEEDQAEQMGADARWPPRAPAARSSSDMRC